MLKNFVLLFVFFTSSVVFALPSFPIAPDPQLTPGSLCRSSTKVRYPERIKYCKRDVSGGRKRGIFVKYDQMGYRTGSMDRQLFKIDHYIPLCAGGSNEESNLWPQHFSVYRITDQLEEQVCLRMAEGKLSQKNAVELIKKAKNNLSLAPEIEAYVRSL